MDFEGNLKQNKGTQISLNKHITSYEKWKLAKTFGSGLNDHKRVSGLKYEVLKHRKAEKRNIDDSIADELYVVYDKEKCKKVRDKLGSYYLDDQNLKQSKDSLSERYMDKSISVSKVSSMTKEEKKIYQFLNKTIEDTKPFRLPEINKPLNSTDKLVPKKYDKVKVYKLYKPNLDKWYENMSKPVQEGYTQTNHYQSYLPPIWRTSEKIKKKSSGSDNPNNKSMNETSNQSNKLPDILLKSYEYEQNRENHSITYSAYDLRNCRYLRIKQDDEFE